MTTFDCTYQELRKLSGEYVKAIPTATIEELDAGLRCVQLHYLGMKPAADHEIAGAAALLRIVSREYMKAELRLMETEL